MQVHQTSESVVGIMAGGGGLFILLVCLYECLKSKAVPPWARQPLVWAVFAITMGAEHLSRSFDEPHQESHRTILIGCLSLLVVFIGIAWIIILNRAEKKAKVKMGITSLGEHT